MFSIVLAILVALAAWEMFGLGASAIALLVFAFEPTILGHGALVTTDMGLACCFFAAVYTLYRYLKVRSIWRLLACALATGLTLAAKHSGLLIFVVLGLLLAIDVIRMRSVVTKAQLPWRRILLERFGALAIVVVLSGGILWSFYGFRYAARPGKSTLIPPTGAFLQTLKHSPERPFIEWAERIHLLPEAYLYGLTDVSVLNREGRYTYLLGRLYPEGRWFYFPNCIPHQIHGGLSSTARLCSHGKVVVVLTVPHRSALPNYSGRAFLGNRHALEAGYRHPAHSSHLPVPDRSCRGRRLGSLQAVTSLVLRCRRTTLFARSVVRESLS